jgi:HTH-type transcriptional regulator, competence development regulator
VIIFNCHSEKYSQNMRKRFILSKSKTLSIFLKKLRLEHDDETMTDMARRLNISVSYLSSVENEKRNMTDEMYLTICRLYLLNKEQCDELQYLKNLASKRLNVQLDGLDKNAKQTTVKFLSNVDSLSDDDLERINKIINKKGK